MSNGFAVLKLITAAPAEQHAFCPFAMSFDSGEIETHLSNDKITPIYWLI